MLLPHSGSWKKGLTIRRLVPVPPVPQVLPDYRRRQTLAVRRTVLFAVHTVTSLDRLEDIALLVEADPRVRLLYTQVPDHLGDGVSRRLEKLEVSVIPWSEATNGRWTWSSARACTAWRKSRP
jgi:hypothetical protein